MRRIYVNLPTVGKKRLQRHLREVRCLCKETVYGLNSNCELVVSASGIALHVQATHLILRGSSAGTPEAGRWPGEGPGEPVSLQALVILYVLGELAERIRARRALGPTKEGHVKCVARLAW